ncbi:MAG: ABC-2 family transporter protein [Gemmataceae bacterium]|nr:ABC-2 family transporter protein [Gemmataceae bacterium]
MPPQTLELPVPTWQQSVGKYLKILRVSLIERLTYRADFFVSTFLRFLPLLTTFLLWEAVFASSGAKEISGFSHDQMLAYLLLVQISRMFSSMPGLASGISRDIRDGNLKKYLLQPIDMIAYLISYRGAHKIAYIATSAAPYGILFFFFRDKFNVMPDLTTWAAYLASLLMGFMVGFFFEAAVGMAGFWLLEVTSLLYIIHTLNFIISGHMFPLDLLNPALAGFLKLLPFQYLAYFPAMIFLGKIQGQELANGLAVEFAWAFGLFLTSRYLYRVGLRRYSAYGG